MCTEMSDFWRRKMETLFTRIDMDGDEMLTSKDFLIFGEKLVECGHLDVNRGAQLKAILAEAYVKFVTEADQPVKKEEYLQDVKSIIGHPDLKRIVTGLYSLFFASIDTNGDGLIQQEEFELFFEVLGFDTNMAKIAFQAIDTNKDGLLSKEEYVAAAMEFVTGTDESSPTKYLWGPLV